MRSIYRLLAVGAFAAFVGCESAPPPKPADVEVSGTAKLANGQPAKNVTVAFSPTSGTQNANSAKTDGTGSFKVTLKPGEYRISVEAIAGQADAFKAVPDSYKSVSADHSVTIDASNPTLSITLQ